MPSPSLSSSSEALIDLTRPPEVVAQGSSVHGVGRATDTFQLPRLWSLHLYDYTAEIEVDGTTFAIMPGSVSLVPPAAMINYRYRGASRHLYAHLAVDPLGDSNQVQIPIVQTVGSELAFITALMISAIGSAASRPERTRSDIWTVLWRLADVAAAERVEHQDAPVDHVRAAMTHIEHRLSEPITVPEIAAAVGISHNHLTRLFSTRTGQTVVGYLRQRRVDHARHLLRSSTMSIAAIAALVGIPDLQAFNKTCRAVTGLSPRQLRSGNQESSGS